MERRAGIPGSWAVTVLFALAAALLFAGNVVSGADADTRELEEYYLEKERGLVLDIRGMLQGEGLVNSGVMVTRVIDADGSRNYTITVHHGDIDRMSDEERQQLLCRLEALCFSGEDLSFSHQFLLGD